MIKLDCKIEILKLKMKFKIKKMFYGFYMSLVLFIIYKVFLVCKDKYILY